MYEGEENPGTFVVLQLYHNRDAQNAILFQPWNHETKYDGPVYGRRWDPLNRTPFQVMNVSPEDVFSGKVISLVKEALTPIRQRIEESEREVEAEWESRCTDLSGEMASFMEHRANRTDASAPIVAKKFLTKHDKDILSGDYDRSLKRKGAAVEPGAKIR